MAYSLILAKPVSYGGTRALTAIKYIVIHYTGVSNDTAKNECNFFKNGNTRSAGAHFFCDRSGQVYQSIPLNRTAWSVGGFYTQANGAGYYYNVCTNFNSVSIELCDLLTKDPSSSQTEATKKLVKYIQSQCPNAKTIIRHWDVNGKLCPARMAGKDNAKWTSFKKAITKGGSTPTPTPEPTPTTAYKVKVNTLDLNVRKGPGVNYDIVTVIHRNEVYTIVDTKDGWGKLKSGAGWINLYYTKKA